jgi:uncharacterized protein YjbI with pentapeptide repeats
MALNLINTKPRLFISYARQDVEIAGSINSSLLDEGYTTFFDTKSILVGDVFPDKIANNLKKCDGCLAIISAASIKSEWCKLETYYAHIFKKPIIPVKIKGSGFDADSPLNNIQKNINYTIIEDESQLPQAIELIKNRLLVTKKRARLRIFKNAIISLCIILFVFSIFKFGIKKINSIKYKEEKVAFLTDIKQSNKIVRAAEIDILKNKFNNDQELISQLHLQESDPGLSGIARINSKILSSAFLKSFNLSQRQYFENINWNLSELANNQIINSTFNSGNITQVSFKNTQFDDVYFAGIDSAQQGIKLSGIEFSSCGFNTVYFDKSNIIDVRFNACRFKGSILNTTNFGAVNFYSDTSSNNNVITNGRVTFFENCVFQNSNPPDEPGVMVLGKEEEMQFIDVVFDQCRFVGLMRPEWFKHCTFENCVFPTAIILEKLKNNNFINNSNP